MRSFGEMAIIIDHANKKLRSKLDDRGLLCMFVGYANHHDKDVYKFFNLKTRCVLHSRDVIWLNKTYSEHFGIKKLEVIKQIDSSDSDSEDSDKEEEEDTELQVQVIPQDKNQGILPVPFPKPKMTREIRNLQLSKPKKGKIGR